MFVIGSNSASTGYNLTRSLRTRASASGYLNRTPASATNRKTWTWSGWVKRGTLGTVQVLFQPYSAAGNYFWFLFTGSDTLYIQQNPSNTIEIATSQVFRDPSAWYYIVLAVDTTQATAANRIKLYVNDAQVTAFGTATYPAQNSDTFANAAVAHYIGTNNASSNYYDGYLAEVNFIDGQALTPSSFGSTNALTGVWQPAAYTGSYGTNGFYLPFTDNSALTTASNVGLGKDFSGNANYWVTNNISITAGTTYDSMTDVPTLTSATAANFAVLNPIDKGANLTASDGNLQYQITVATVSSIRNTFVLPSTGKWYWEATKIAYGNLLAGIATNAASLTNYVGSDAFGWGYFSFDGLVYNNGTTIRTGATLANGDILGIAFDSGAGSLSFYKNNVLQATAITGFTPATVNYFAAAGSTSGGGILNFGQRPFTYTAPSGYVALNTYNLPTSTIVKGNTVMDATTWTGNNATNAIVNAAAFKPDLVWIKDRSRAGSHVLVDSVRGITKALSSDGTWSETTYSFTQMSSINSNGFTLTANTTADNYYVNVNADTFVGWQWQAGQGTSSSNTNGTITSTVSVNASAGFSVVTFTANGTAGATIGHGLGVAPAFYIIKSRSNSPTDWMVYSQVLGTGFLYLSLTNAYSSSNFLTNGVAPTSSVITLGSSSNFNVNGYTNVVYAWTPIAGFSAFGSYTGNGSSDGPFVYMGFRPKYILIKSSSYASDWIVEDSAINTYNVANTKLSPNTSNAEYTSTNDVGIDFLSNGFKVKGVDAAVNGSGQTYIYACYAENPFRNALAR